tara:strand:+ start:2804 stop:3892 length:1089 start_codon:yes stop_codon:yes gene_type:complete
MLAVAGLASAHAGGSDQLASSSSDAIERTLSSLELELEHIEGRIGHRTPRQALERRRLDGRWGSQSRPHPPVTAPLFVLNLERRRDRLEEFREALERDAPSLLPVACRVPAIDGANLHADMPPRLISPQKWREAKHHTDTNTKTESEKLTRNAVALYLGHAAIWRAVAAQKLPWALVAEDDLGQYDPSALMERLADLNRTRSSWDVVQLQHCGSELWPKDSDVGHPTAPPEAGTPHELVDGPRCCAAFYAISRQGAEKALREFFPITTQLDSAWYEQREGGAVSFKHYEPPLAQAVELRGGAYDTNVQQLEQRAPYGAPLPVCSYFGTGDHNQPASPARLAGLPSWLSGGELDDESVSTWWV